MNIDEIGEVLKLFEESQFDELLIEAEGVRIGARREGAGTRPAAPAHEPAVTAGPGLEPSRMVRSGQPKPEAGSQAASSAPIAGAVAVRAPVGGTFYRASSPTAEPFVVEGARVRAEDPVGLIEVMKLFNHVPAGAAGEVVQIACENAAIVEAGEILMYIHPHK